MSEHDPRLCEEHLKDGQILREFSRRLDALEQRLWERERDEIVHRIEKLEARIEQQRARG